MPYKSIHRTARISPTKARLALGLIRGRSAQDALGTLTLSKKRAAVLIRRILVSAMANAEQGEVDQRQLYVCEARADQGPTIKRFQPKDRGRAHPIRKRTSHITVAVDVIK